MLGLIQNEDDMNHWNTNRKKMLANLELLFPYIKENDLVYVSTVIMEISITVQAWNQETEEMPAIVSRNVLPFYN